MITTLKSITSIQDMFMRETCSSFIYVIREKNQSSGHASIDLVITNIFFVNQPQGAKLNGILESYFEFPWSSS